MCAFQVTVRLGLKTKTSTDVAMCTTRFSCHRFVGGKSLERIPAAAGQTQMIEWFSYSIIFQSHSAVGKWRPFGSQSRSLSRVRLGDDCWERALYSTAIAVFRASPFRLSPATRRFYPGEAFARSVFSGSQPPAEVIRVMAHEIRKGIFQMHWDTSSAVSPYNTAWPPRRTLSDPGSVARSNSFCPRSKSKVIPHI